jgi:hypothetical protein
VAGLHRTGQVCPESVAAKGQLVPAVYCWQAAPNVRSKRKHDRQAQQWAYPPYLLPGAACSLCLSEALCLALELVLCCLQQHMMVLALMVPLDNKGGF